MRQLNLHSTMKIRGQKRRMRALKRWASSFEGHFPLPDAAGNNWYTKLPIHEGMVDGPRVRYGIRRAVIGELLDVCESLRRAKLPAYAQSRVVACVILPDIFSASIDIFYSEDAFTTFVTRPGISGEWEGQSWTPLPASRSLQSEWHLPTNLPERGYHVEIHEVCNDEEYHYSGEIWLVGDVG
ncbi:MAG: DUF3916 domain-containing protein [bacterium]